MFKNLLKIAFRNLWKQKTFSVINVLGLAIGMACCFMIVQYVVHETSYDRFHKNLDRLYRITYHLSFTQETDVARIPPAFATQIPENFPEIEQVARMYPRNVSVTVPSTDKQFEVEQVYFADSNITKIFQFDFLHGNANTALAQPFSVVLTDKMATTLFGTTDVIGKELRLVDASNFKVTGVIKDWPDHAHMRLSMIVPFRNMVDLEPDHARDILKQVLERNWIATYTYTYVLLKENHKAEEVNAKFPAYIDKYGRDNIKEKQAFSLFPVKDIHLKSEQGLEPLPTTSMTSLYLFIGIGFITLLIAAINFVNLTTAGSLNRAKEVGVRKVMGATRGLLVSQFLGESLILSFIAFVLSIFIAALAMPLLNSLTNLEMVFAPWQNPKLLFSFIGIFAIVGILAGAYPAFFVSRFQAITSLKGGAGSTKKQGGVNIRKGLITLQFLATITFISGVVIMFLQLNFLRNQSLGFEKELTLQVPIESEGNLNAAFRPGDATIRQRMNTLDEQLLNNPKIKSVTQCARLPGFGAVGRMVWNEQVPQTESFTASVNSVDYDYAESFGLEVIAGREFDVSFGTDHLNNFVLNEAAVRALKWESPEAAIGEKLSVERADGKVIGVVKDFHFTSLYNEIDPLILRVQPGDFANFAIQIENGNIPQTLSFIKSKWKEFFPGKVFEYNFLEENLVDAYEADQSLMDLISYFAFLAILISCFGLFGLATLVTQHRFKEIGIRKVLGASVLQILRLLSADFIKLIAIAMVMAVPIIWYFSNQWMEDFAFRIAFPWWVPIVVGFGIILLAFLSVSSKTIQAATANPVESLRAE